MTICGYYNQHHSEFCADSELLKSKNKKARSSLSWAETRHSCSSCFPFAVVTLLMALEIQKRLRETSP